MERLSRIRGSLLAGAVGDALGAPVEFWSWRQIRERCGPDGVTGYLPAYGRDGGAITDDTQMTLFTADGLLRSEVARAATGDPRLLELLWDAYQRWLYTQDPRATVEPDGWLVRESVLHDRRAPGLTCLSALAGDRPGSRARPVNDSKGCGGVMRVAPVGLLATVADPFAAAADAAALTHGHPSGYLSAGVLAHTVRRLVEGASLRDALGDAIARLREEPGHAETADALERAVALADVGPTPERLEALGGGWTGEEALAIAVACALEAEDVRAGLLLAVNHSGDTDSTGSICGNLLGAWHGAEALPREWLCPLEAREVVERIARDLHAAGEPGAMHAYSRWQDDYPVR